MQLTKGNASFSPLLVSFVERIIKIVRLQITRRCRRRCTLAQPRTMALMNGCTGEHWQRATTKLGTRTIDDQSHVITHVEGLEYDGKEVRYAINLELE